MSKEEVEAGDVVQLDDVEWPVYRVLEVRNMGHDRLARVAMVRAVSRFKKADTRKWTGLQL